MVDTLRRCPGGEMVDTQGLGPCASNGVEVQVLSWARKNLRDMDLPAGRQGFKSYHPHRE